MWTVDEARLPGAELSSGSSLGVGCQGERRQSGG